MTITNIKDVNKIIIEALSSGYNAELIINGECYPLHIKGIINKESGTLRKYREHNK